MKSGAGRACNFEEQILDRGQGRHWSQGTGLDSEQSLRARLVDAFRPPQKTGMAVMMQAWQGGENDEVMPCCQC